MSEIGTYEKSKIHSHNFDFSHNDDLVCYDFDL